MRSFIAIPLAETVARPLAGWLAAAPIARGVRYVNPAQLHVTLKFLGDVDEGQRPQIERVLRETAAAVPSFTLALAALGAFPSARRPRVLWCGLRDPADGCRAWLTVAEPQLAALGLTSDLQPFTPHVTLARSKAPTGGRTLRTLLERGAPLPTSAEMTVFSLTLFASELRPDGAVYRPLLTTPLAPD